MDEFDPHQFVSGMKDDLDKLQTGQERKAYIAGALSSVPKDFKVLVTALIDLLKDIDDDVLILIHGIRTPAVWQSNLEAICEGEVPNLSVIPVKYGYIDVIRFCLPGFRKGPIEKTKKQIRLARDQSRNGSISVIAHSFGTYIISEILKAESDIKVRRLITCGSIVCPEFDWDMLPGNLKEKVVNDVGCKDVLPVLAKAATVGYGPSGFYGFGAARVKDRFHDLSHSGFFSDEFMSEFWLPILKENKVVSSKHKRAEPETVKKSV
jgi:pimeloyl-ACP methyl ester carboxylesterase